MSFFHNNNHYKNYRLYSKKNSLLDSFCSHGAFALDGAAASDSAASDGGARLRFMHKTDK